MSGVTFRHGLVLGIGLGSLIPLAVDLATSGWYWNHFVSTIPTPTRRAA